VGYTGQSCQAGNTLVNRHTCRMNNTVNYFRNKCG